MTPSHERGLTHASGSSKEAFKKRTRIVSSHQGLADQCGMDTGCNDPAYVVDSSDSAFADDRACSGDLRSELLSHAQVQFERRKIPIVNADERSADIQRAFDFALVMDLDQAVDPDLLCSSAQMLEFIVAQRGNNEKDGVGAREGGLINLHLVEREILAQKRIWNLLAYKGQIIKMAVKEFLVR